MTYPKILQIGSGREFKAEWLNLDMDGTWSPDLVVDISKPLPAEPLPSDRFGSVSLLPGGFDEIVAFDVLEHIPDMVTAMTNCLVLLREDGVMKIKVPYDLSLGAWQDPTHVRAFNENSFHYYCEWFWYLGWEDHRFHKQRIDLMPSEFGQSLVDEGRLIDEVARTPRAIDAVYAELVKRPLTDQDRVELARFRSRG